MIKRFVIVFNDVDITVACCTLVRQTVLCNCVYWKLYQVYDVKATCFVCRLVCAENSFIPSILSVLFFVFILSFSFFCAFNHHL